MNSPLAVHRARLVPGTVKVPAHSSAIVSPREIRAKELAPPLLGSSSDDDIHAQRVPPTSASALSPLSGVKPSPRPAEGEASEKQPVEQIVAAETHRVSPTSAALAAIGDSHDVLSPATARRRRSSAQRDAMLQFALDDRSESLTVIAPQPSSTLTPDPSVDHASCEGALRQLREELETAQAALASAHALAEAATTRADQASFTARTADAVAARLMVESQALEARVDTVDALQAEKAALEDHIGAMRTAMSAEKAALEARVSSLSAEVARLEANIGFLSATTHGLDGKLGQLQAENASLRAHAEKLSATNHAFEATVLELNHGRAHAEAVAEGLAGDVAQLQLDVATLHTAIAGMREDKAAVGQILLRLKHEKAAAVAHAGALQAELDALRGELDASHAATVPAASGASQEPTTGGSTTDAPSDSPALRASASQSMATELAGGAVRPPIEAPAATEQSSAALVLPASSSVTSLSISRSTPAPASSQSVTMASSMPAPAPATAPAAVQEVSCLCFRSRSR